MVLTHFGRSRRQFGSVLTLREASRCLVACKGGGFGDLAVLGRFGVKIKKKKNRLWRPVEAVSAKFSGDIKVAHGDSATDEPKKNQLLSR